MKRLLVGAALLSGVVLALVVSLNGSAAQRTIHTYHCLGTSGVVTLNVQNLDARGAKVQETTFGSNGAKVGSATLLIPAHGFDVHTPGALAVQLRSTSRLLAYMVVDDGTADARPGRCI